MKWHYKGEADITLGEVHVSPLPKILTALIIFAVVAIGTTGFIFRYYLYDLFVNPHIVLTTDSVNVHYGDSFNSYNYISKSGTVKYEDFRAYILESGSDGGIILNEHPTNIEEYPYKAHWEGDVNTHELGTYTVTFYSSNRIRKNETTLTVNVVDVEKPILAITQPEKPIPLMKKDFNALDESNALEYAQNAGKFDLSNCVTVNDNYSSREKMKFDFSNPIQGSTNEYVKTFSIECTVTDENGNKSAEENSAIIISFQLVADTSEYDERIAELEKENEEIKEATTNTKPANNGGNTGNSGNNKQDTGTDTGNNQPSGGGDYAGNICPYCGGHFTDSEFPAHIQTHRE